MIYLSFYLLNISNKLLISFKTQIIYVKIYYHNENDSKFSKF